MKSKRTKDLEISQATRQKVLERQKNLSITGRYSSTYHLHHFVSKGASGCSFHWNLIALLPEEHIQYHNGGKVGRYTHEEFQTLMRNHLVIHYSNWSLDKCKYKKGYEESDYGVRDGTLANYK